MALQEGDQAEKCDEEFEMFNIGLTLEAVVEEQVITDDENEDIPLHWLGAAEIFKAKRILDPDPLHWLGSRWDIEGQADPGSRSTPLVGITLGY